MSKYVFDENHERFDVEEALTISKGKWSDGNPYRSDRVGLFVTSENENNEVSVAGANSYICGVTVVNDVFLGLDKNDPKYCVVQSLGVCTVRDDGTLQAGDKCMPANDGTAVKSSNDLGYRVVGRVDSTRVQIVMSPNNDMIQRIKKDVTAAESDIDKLEGDIVAVDDKVPFGFGIDKDSNYGYIKAGEKNITLFGTGSVELKTAEVSHQSAQNPASIVAGKDGTAHIQMIVRKTVDASTGSVTYTVKKNNTVIKTETLDGDKEVKTINLEVAVQASDVLYFQSSTQSYLYIFASMYVETAASGSGGEPVYNVVLDRLQEVEEESAEAAEKADKCEEDVDALKEEIEQVDSRLSESITEISNNLIDGNIPLISAKWEVGGFDGGKGTDSVPETDKRVRSDLFVFAKSEDVSIKVADGYRAFIGYFDSDGHWTYVFGGWITGEKTLSVNTINKYRVQIGKISEETVTDVYSYVRNLSCNKKILVTTAEYESTVIQLADTIDEVTDLKKEVASVNSMFISENVVVADSVLRKNKHSLLLKDGTVMYDTINDRVVSDFINIDNSVITSIYAVGAITLGGGNCAFVAFYNDKTEESFISSVPVTDGKVLTGNWRYLDDVTIPNGAKYIRLAGLSAVFTPVSPTLEYNKKSLKPNYEKEPYSANTIYFKIKVNQNFIDNDSEAMANADGETFADVWCALRLPSNYTPYEKPCKLAMFCHGAGEAGIIDGDTDTAVAFKRDSEELVNSGYAVFDLTGNNQQYFQHMGSMRSISAYKKAYEYIVKRYNVETSLYVLGQSMGGLTALNFCMWNKDIVRACAVAYPVTDLKGQAWDNPWFGQSASDPTRVALAREYNFDSYNTYLSSHNYNDLVFEADKIKGFSPIENDSVVIGTDRYNGFPCPLKIIHGKADTTVSYTGTEALKTALKNRGCYAEIRFVNDLTHSIYAWLRQELLMFINRY